jgi:alpha-N-arabinofuranosidase
MKHRFSIALVLAVLGAASSLSAQPWPTNGNFTQPGNPPAGWHIDPEGKTKGDVRIVAGSAGGERILELVPNARNTPSEKPLGIGQLLPPGPLRGFELEVSAKLSASGGAVPVVGVAVLRRGGGVSDSIQLRPEGEPMSTRVAQITVPDDPQVEAIILFLVVEGTQGIARFSDVSVKPTRRVGAMPPPSLGKSTSSISASVRVDTTRVVRQIPRGVFGTNIETIREANGLWDADNQRLDPQIVQLSRELKLGPIRFPGGVWSDTYDWRDGVGPRAHRAAKPTHPGATEKVRNLFGTDEALAFAREAGSSLLITVNAATGTPQLAADWLRYVNGEHGKAPRNGRVDVWEIGNELYMEGDASGGHLSPEKYAERFLAFSAAMRAVDPSIKLAAIGLRNFGRYRLAARDDWIEAVLKKAGKEIDLLAIHNAYSPVVANGKGVDPADVYAALLAAPLLIARNLKDTWRDVERFAPTRTGQIGLAITEWGPLYAIDPGSPWIDHVKTLGSALFVASTLKVFAEDPHVAVANFFKLNEASFMGWIGRSGSSWIATAPYLAFRMIATDMEENLLAATVESPRYNSKTVGFVDRVTGVPYVEAMASQSNDGRRISLMLINKHLSSAADTSVVLSGAAQVSTVTSRTLTGPAVDANTGTQLPRVPGLTWARQQQAGPQGRFHHGAPAEVRIDTASLTPGATLTVRVPPHSMTIVSFQNVSR